MLHSISGNAPFNPHIPPVNNEILVFPVPQVPIVNLGIPAFPVNYRSFQFLIAGASMMFWAGVATLGMKALGFESDQSEQSSLSGVVSKGIFIMGSTGAGTFTIGLGLLIAQIRRAH